MTNLTNWFQVQGSRLKGYIMLISVTLCFTHWVKHGIRYN